MVPVARLFDRTLLQRLTQSGKQTLQIELQQRAGQASI